MESADLDMWLIITLAVLAVVLLERVRLLDLCGPGLAQCVGRWRQPSIPSPGYDPQSCGGKTVDPNRGL